LTVCDNLAVSGSLDGTVKVWKPASGECVHIMQGHGGKIFAVQIARDGNRLATGDKNGNIIV
jgi:F-box and WD-40 domain protein CDC4